MKLTFPILTLVRGGAQRMLAELANRLVAMGHEVIILMPLGGITEFQITGRIIFADTEELLVSDFPVADVIISNFYTTVAVSQQASEQGKGVHIRLALCYEPTFLPNNNKSFTSYHITRNLLVLSRWQQEIIRLNHGIKGEIVPIGVDSDFYNQGIREKKGNRLIISAIMRKPEDGFADHREQVYLLEQLSRVKKIYPEVDIYIITPPNEFAGSKMLQALLNTGNYHICTPSNDAELCSHYGESDIFVSSSAYDTGSLPGLEAMRCGAALVTIYAGGNTEYCIDRQNCLMSFRHENRLAIDISLLIEDKNLRQRLAKRGEHDSRHFTWKRSAQIFEKEILRMVSRQK